MALEEVLALAPTGEEASHAEVEKGACHGSGWEEWKSGLAEFRLCHLRRSLHQQGLLR